MTLAQSSDLTVHLERQPHRDAVRRLREAYRRLWLGSQLPEPEPILVEEPTQALDSVQEVQS
jgi:hypothetical protein